MTETTKPDVAADARRGSLNRILARFVLAPFVGSRLTPNHITTLRMIAGAAACAAFAGGEGTRILAGWLWVLSAFLDRCDGEFARMTGQSSRFGKIYDFIGDVVINGAVFICAGIGLGAGALGGFAVPLGLYAGIAIMVAALVAEFNERGMDQGVKTFKGVPGFDFDDLIYLIAFFAWFDIVGVLLVGGALGGSVALGLILFQVWQKRRAA